VYVVCCFHLALISTKAVPQEHFILKVLKNSDLKNEGVSFYFHFEKIFFILK
tara:strand:+ start:628 stop:783 length:156 start_codon:yes stop_codon:yes gene_type:complete